MKRVRIFSWGFSAAIVAAVAVFIFAAKSSRTAAPAAPRVGTVTLAAPMLEPRSGHSATLLPDGGVLIAGGMRRNQDFYRSAEIYDPGTGKFQKTGEMNVARVGHAAVLLRSGSMSRSSWRKPRRSTPAVSRAPRRTCLCRSSAWASSPCS